MLSLQLGWHRPSGRRDAFPEFSVTPRVKSGSLLASEQCRSPFPWLFPVPSEQTQPHVLHFPPHLSPEAFVCKQTLLKVGGN